MMQQIEIWQLVVDIGLIASVLTVATKALKVSRLPAMLPKTRELEVSLRSLIDQAESAGLQLNDQLLSREQNIRRSLSEMQSCESRLAKMIAEATALQNHLQSASPAPGVQEPFVEQRYQQAVQSQPVSPQKNSSPVEVADNSPVTPITKSKTPDPAAELRRSYKSAEALIREGQSLESIASQVKLPLEGVKLLAQMIEIERDEDLRKKTPSRTLPTSDSRLGALGAVRRQSAQA